MPLDEKSIEKMIETVEERMRIWQPPNGEYDQAKELVKKAYELLEKKSFDEAFASVNGALTIVDKVQKQLASEELAFARALISELKNAGAETGELREFLKKTRQALEKNEYLESHNTIIQFHKVADKILLEHEDIKNKLLKAQRESEREKPKPEEKKVADISTEIHDSLKTHFKVIVEIFKKLSTIKSVGINIDSLHPQIEQIMVIINNLNDQSAAILKGHITKNIEMLTLRIEKFKSANIDVSELSKLIEETNTHLNENKLIDAFENLQMIADKTENPDYYLKLINGLVSAASQLKVDTKDVQNRIAEAELYIQNKNYSSAIEIIVTNLTDLEQRINEVVSGETAKYSENIDQFLKYGLNLRNDLNDIITNINSTLGKGLLLTAVDNYLLLQKKFRESFEGYFTPRINGMKVRISAANNMGIKFKDQQNIIITLKKYYVEKEYLKCLMVLDDFEKEMDTTMSLFKEATDIINDLDNELDKARKEGFDILEIENILRQAVNIKNENLPEAINKAREGLNKIKEIKEKPVKEELPEKVVEKPIEEKKLFGKENASGTESCGVCRGKIKAGFQLLKCTCGMAYHELCIKRLKKCTKCGNVYSE